MYLPEWAQKFKEPKTEIRIIGGHCYNGYVYETFGISKHFPVKLQALLIRAKTLGKPLTAKCFIHDVVCCPSFILFCLSVI